MLRVEPSVRSWEATYAFIDPARTWVGNRLVVWDGGAEAWAPDQIINHIFKLAADYRPVVIGVERDGLEEWVLQPLRAEQLRRGQLIPVAGYRRACTLATCACVKSS